MGVDVKWNKPIPKIVNEAIGGDKTQLFMANEAKRLMDPYVPAMNEVLSQNVRVYVEGGLGVVHYLSKYAHYQHEGILMVSRITGSAWARQGESKVATGKKLKHKKSKHPHATAEWEKAMKAAKMGELTRAVQRFVNGGRG